MSVTSFPKDSGGDLGGLLQCHRPTQHPTLPPRAEKHRSEEDHRRFFSDKRSTTKAALDSLWLRQSADAVPPLPAAHQLPSLQNLLLGLKKKEGTGAKRECGREKRQATVNRTFTVQM